LRPPPARTHQQRQHRRGAELPLFAGYAIENRVKETLALEDKARADLDSLQRTVAQSARAAFFGVQSGLARSRRWKRPSTPARPRCRPT
jgi:outer membrane protein TolC